MRLLFIHPSVLPYSEISLRVEALGLERVAAARAAGHEVPILDPQVFGHADLDHELAMFRPEAVGFGLNYLANVPEVIDLAHRVKQRLPGCFVLAGGHSVSFLTAHLLEQAQDTIDAVVRREGEPIVGPLLAAAPDRAAHEISGIVTRYVSGPARYELPLPDHQDVRLRQRRELYIHHPRSAIHH